MPQTMQMNDVTLAWLIDGAVTLAGDVLTLNGNILIGL